jgi:hypothetical protein
MREIKFRQKPKNKTEIWHYWGYIENNQHVFVSPLDANQGGESYQYTGQKDNHGKDMYEGDIIKHRQLENMGSKINTGIYQMMYFEDFMQFCLADKNGKPVNVDPYGIFEVIGNIYQHGELLNGNIPD